jgi:glycerate kinase
MRVVAAVDKFKGTATADAVAQAIGHACWELGHDCVEVPLADGGEGTLEALGGANRTSTVTGPLGDPVEAEWRFHRGTAVIEMARASGLALAGGPDGNDPVAASTTGTGELIDKALDLGAERIIVCLGGSATTDGGLGAVRAIHAPARLRGVEFLVACDVETLFLDAPREFGPQKGATPRQIRLLESRLERLVQLYKETHGVDVSRMEGAGAAGGLAGGLLALGATLIPGFDMVADEVGLHDHLRDADMVITGEGQLDITSFEGKVVGGVVDLAHTSGLPVGVICGRIHPSARDAAEFAHITAGVASLVDDYGEERALNEPLWCIEHTALELLRKISPPSSR